MVSTASNAPGVYDNRLFTFLLQAPKWRLLACAGALAATVALVDWRVGLDVSLGAFYVLPVVLAGAVLSRAQIVGFTAVCAVLRVAFNPAQQALEQFLGFVVAWIVYVGVGFFVIELVRNRLLVIRHLEEIREQQNLRQEAEEQLRVFAESSPAAIMTMDGLGNILAANRAAYGLFGLTRDDALIGRNIGHFLPLLSDALKIDAGPEGFRTAAQCRGKRHSGELFNAHTWFSTYAGPYGRRLAAIAVDSSEEMREREEQNLRQLLHSNRVVAGAVSHDIRNLCGAIGVVYSNLKRAHELEGDQDFHALGTLVDGLGRIAATELRSRLHEDLGIANLTQVLEQLRIIIEPAWREIDGQVHWRTPDRTLYVHGEQTGILQVFLNLVHNSHRAVQATPAPKLYIVVDDGSTGKVLVRVQDSGSGVRNPEALFQPFQPGAESAGIGLYVSRAIVRSYGGELRHQPDANCCCFAVELPLAQRKEAVAP